MAKIEIKRNNPLGKAAAREKTEQLAKGMEAKLGIEWTWQGDRLTFTTPKGMAKNTKGSVTVADTTVHVLIDLPLILSGFKGKVADRIGEELDKLGLR